MAKCQFWELAEDALFTCFFAQTFSYSAEEQAAVFWGSEEFSLPQ